jgi:hypothetical protein
VFESVDPAGQPWLNWNRETTYARRESPDAGAFESWSEVTGVDGDLVSIRRTYVFVADGTTLTSEGTRRYPPRPVIEDSLTSVARTPACPTAGDGRRGAPGHESASRRRRPQSHRITSCGSPWPNKPRSCAAASPPARQG